MNLLDLEHHARELVSERGAESCCYWDYAPSFGDGPFRNVICLSVNDAVLHGKPRSHVLADGDVLTLDFAVSIDGWVADAAITVIAGDGGPDREANQCLIDSTGPPSPPVSPPPSPAGTSAISPPPSAPSPSTRATR